MNTNTETTQANHTPGPWHVQPNPEWSDSPMIEHRNRFITCGNPDMTSDDFAHDPNSYIICSLRDCQNQRANALLIAAAPTMYHFIERVGSSACLQQYVGSKCSCFSCQARELIAKANGGGAQ